MVLPAGRTLVGVQQVTTLLLSARHSQFSPYRHAIFNVNLPVCVKLFCTMRKWINISNVFFPAWQRYHSTYLTLTDVLEKFQRDPCQWRR